MSFQSAKEMFRTNDHNIDLLLGNNTEQDMIMMSSTLLCRLFFHGSNSCHIFALNFLLGCIRTITNMESFSCSFKTQLSIIYITMIQWKVKEKQLQVLLRHLTQTWQHKWLQKHPKQTWMLIPLFPEPGYHRWLSCLMVA